MATELGFKRERQVWPENGMSAATMSKGLHFGPGLSAGHARGAALGLQEHPSQSFPLCGRSHPPREVQECPGGWRPSDGEGFPLYKPSIQPVSL